MQRAILDTRLAVRRALDAAEFAGYGAQPHPLVLVALSGGADSLALAAAVAAEARGCGTRAGAIIIDHGLQPETERVSKRAAELADSLGLSPVLVRRVTVVGDHTGPEAAARHARYDAFIAAAAETGAAAVLTAHTRDDQAEQVLLALARGSGTRSLAGIPLTRALGDSAVMLRPFLSESPEITRAVTEQACRELGLEAWHDPHNRDTSFARVRVRRTVLPTLEQELGSGAVAALARSADLAREDADALDQFARETVSRAIPAPSADPIASAPGARALPGGEAASAPVKALVAVLAAAPSAVRHRAIRLIASHYFGAQIARRHVLAIAALITDWRGQGPVFAPGVRATREGGSLVFTAQIGSPRSRE